MPEVYNIRGLSHSKWDCKYQVIFAPKRRRKVILGQTRRQWEPIFHSLARQKECRILEGHLMPDPRDDWLPPQVDSTLAICLAIRFFSCSSWNV